jgi:hypothetical protein
MSIKKKTHTHTHTHTNNKNKNQEEEQKASQRGERTARAYHDAVAGSSERSEVERAPPELAESLVGTVRFFFGATATLLGSGHSRGFRCGFSAAETTFFSFFAHGGGPEESTADLERL